MDQSTSRKGQGEEGYHVGLPLPLCPPPPHTHWVQGESRPLLALPVTAALTLGGLGCSGNSINLKEVTSESTECRSGFRGETKTFLLLGALVPFPQSLLGPVPSPFSLPMAA
jgi:hypothetical protein